MGTGWTKPQLQRTRTSTDMTDIINDPSRFGEGAAEKMGGATPPPRLVWRVYLESRA